MRRSIKKMGISDSPLIKFLIHVLEARKMFNAIVMTAIYERSLPHELLRATDHQPSEIYLFETRRKEWPEK